MRLAGAQAEYIADSVAYFRIIMSGQFFACIGMTINAAQRGCGNTKVSMRSNVTANLVNIVFNYFLINGKWFFPKLGVVGAAIATAIGHMVAFLMALMVPRRAIMLENAKSPARSKRQVSLPEFRAFCRPFHGKTLAQKTAELRQCYIEAITDYSLDIENKMCVQMPIDEPDSGMYVIPVTAESEGCEIKQFPAIASALCVYYRGAYENFPKVHAQLLAYAEQHRMTPHGFFRNIYMEGPPTHGANKDASLPQIALPIKFVTVEP